MRRQSRRGEAPEQSRSEQSRRTNGHRADRPCRPNSKISAPATSVAASSNAGKHRVKRQADHGPGRRQDQRQRRRRLREGSDRLPARPQRPQESPWAGAWLRLPSRSHARGPVHHHSLPLRLCEGRCRHVGGRQQGPTALGDFCRQIGRGVIHAHTNQLGKVRALDRITAGRHSVGRRRSGPFGQLSDLRFGDCVSIGTICWFAEKSAPDCVKLRHPVA